ncbi:hypothetical protein F4810DRAFT_686867 [Camillea tinctor]|nr:hypothetical protein F4810DRAFT_686867 [Camillea tinctor]
MASLTANFDTTDRLSLVELLDTGKNKPHDTSGINEATDQLNLELRSNTKPLGRIRAAISTRKTSALLGYGSKMSYTVIQQEKRFTWWSWHAGWKMYGFFLAGIGFAVGHHAYYNFYHGKPANDQAGIMRYGTLLAFLAKANLIWAILAAFRQRAWTTIKKRTLSTTGLDSLIASVDDYLAALNWETARKAKVAMLLAVLTWTGPLVVILSSQALTVEPTIDITECPGPKTLNLTMEEIYEVRDAPTIDGKTSFSLITYNATDIYTSSPHWFDYYTMYSPILGMVADMAIGMGQVVPRYNASDFACGHGWSCKFEVEFVAPGYKCTNITNANRSSIPELNGQKAPFAADILLPEGYYSYYTVATKGDYASEQLPDIWPGGLPNMAPPYPENLGAFRTEPIIWIGHSVFHGRGAMPLDRTVAGWYEAFRPEVFACENYETAYQAEFTYDGFAQSTRILKRDYLRPIMNTTLSSQIADDGTNDNTTAIPTSGYVFPRDKYRYRHVAAYHALGAVFRKWVNGTVFCGNITMVIQTTDMIRTKVFDPANYLFPRPDVPGLIRSIFEDVMLSIFSYPQFYAVVWAKKPDEWSGDAEGNETTLYPCTRYKSELRFRYHPKELWIVYVVTFVLSAAAVVLGTLSILQNDGVVPNMHHSTINSLIQEAENERSSDPEGEDRSDAQHSRSNTP